MRAVRRASDAPVAGIPVSGARDDGSGDQMDGAVGAALSRQVGSSRVGRAAGRARVSDVQKRRTIRVRVRGGRAPLLPNRPSLITPISPIPHRHAPIPPPPDGRHAGVSLSLLSPGQN